MKKIKHIIPIIVMVLSLSTYGQTINSKVIDDGGFGEYKAIAVSDENFLDYTIYRPENLEEAVAKEGKLPVLLHANGGCFNSSLTEEKGLTTIASNGYVVIAIGPFSEKTFSGFPEAGAEDTPEGNIPDMPGMDDVSMSQTSANQLLEALDLIAIENSRQESEYYNKIDLQKVAAEGASCGGLQAISISYDPRIKTVIMQNSGVLDAVSGGPDMSSLTGANYSKDDLKELQVPVIYVVGNEDDVAYPNAIDDFQKINHVPVVFSSNSLVGHEGTSGEPGGGSSTAVKIAWLDWQLKDMTWKSAVFFDEDYAKNQFPEWTIDTKNF